MLIPTNCWSHFHFHASTMERKWESSRDSIDIERCWMSADEHSLSQRTDALIMDQICRTVVNLRARVCGVCMWKDSRRWQPLSQAYRLTLSPAAALKQPSLWHAQKCHELAPLILRVSLCQCRFPPVHTQLCFQILFLCHCIHTCTDTSADRLLHW